MPIQRILIVDDNRDSADTMATLLESLGYTTRVAYGGAQGLDAARDFRPDAVLLDIGLPEMSGHELGKILLRELPLAKIIAVSGYGREADRQKSSEAGFDVHLVKPVDLAALQETLSALDKS